MFLLSVDPASRQTGIAVFNEYGLIVSTHVLSTNAKTWGERLCDLSTQFAELPIEHELITEVCCEHLKGAANSVTLNCISGIFWQYLPNVNLSDKNFITPSSWKALVRRRTGEEKPKGLKSLRLYGYDGPNITDDEADAILIGLCYLDKKRKKK